MRPLPFLLCILCASPLFAQDKRSAHTMPSGIGTYRIELRGLDRFQVETAGDSDGVGELYSIEITLQAQAGTRIEPDEQFHAITETAAVLTNRGADGGDRLTSIDIRAGDIVQTRSRGDPQDNDLWIHDRRMPETDRAISMDFELSIKARELDCDADQRCDQGDDGWVRLLMHLVLPRATIHATCERSNTFTIQPRDGQPSVIGRDILRLTAVLRYSDPRRALREKSGPHLMPLNGEICITTSTASDDWAQPDARTVADDQPTDGLRLDFLSD